MWLLLAGIALAACNAPRTVDTAPAATQPPPVTEPEPAPPPEPVAELPPETGPPSPPATDRYGRVFEDPRLKVGLMLPLSGRGAETGQALLNAAQLAFFDVAAEGLALIPTDTQGTAAGAARAAEALIDDHGVDLVLGPLFGAHVPAARAAARPRAVPVISFTTDGAQAGDGVFVMGFLPETQVRRVTRFARAQGMVTLAAIAPDDAFGNAVLTALQGQSSADGLLLVRTQTYAPGASDFSPAVRSVAQDVAPDAVILPDGGLRVRQVAPLLAFHGIERAQILGTGLWDDPEIGREPALHGAWFAAPPPELRRGFEDRYRQRFGSTPPRVATLGYDAVALAAALARQAGPTDTAPSPYSGAVLTQPTGFAGVDGLFRFTLDGLNERGLAILEVTPDGPAVLDPAPNRFDTPEVSQARF